MCMAFWIQVAFFGAVQGTYYGHKRPNMAYAGGTVLCHTLALLCWGIIADVKLDEETSHPYDEDERVDVYGRTSPDLAIGAIVLLLTTLIIYVLPHLHPKEHDRKSVIVKQPSNTEEQDEDDEEEEEERAM